MGELINSSRKSIHENPEKRNIECLLDIAKKQAEASAAYIDINCSTMMDKESEAMKWLVENIQEVVDIPLSIDTPDPLAMGNRAFPGDLPPIVVPHVKLELLV